MTANRKAVIARVNFFGWSVSGHRSLAEWFVNRLRAGKPTPGFVDVHFCPLLANDLAQLLLRIASSELHGIYHVVSSQRTTKYDFGMALANTFGLDGSLLQAVSVEQSELRAKRSSNLTLVTTKLARALGTSLPTIPDSIAHFRTLHDAGYPQSLRNMAI